jgi:hypothetical protein
VWRSYWGKAIREASEKTLGYFGSLSVSGDPGGRCSAREEFMPVTKQQALDYHFGARPGKIEVTPTKPCRTQRDLSLAYTPGVADPCLEIKQKSARCFQIHRPR